jgi:transcriptional regulator with XRE-family HTH domain
VDGKRQLGEFLQTRRSQLQPEDVGLEAYGERRRVPGLRREELARLAGVSPSYYSRLEQGSSSRASPEVLDAIATALALDDAERRHLHELAAGTRRRARVRRRPPERISGPSAQLLASLVDVPALVLGARSDVLGWNRLGHALYAGHLDPGSPARPADRPNMSRMVFLDAHTRELYADWPAKAKAVVGTLRVASAQHPDDPALASLIGELTVKSAEFGVLWADQRVKAAGTATYEMRHPLVGSMTVTQHSLLGEDGQRVVMTTAESDSPSQAAITLLAHDTTATAATTAINRPLGHKERS